MSKSTLVGTPIYMAPEIAAAWKIAVFTGKIPNLNYTQNVDVYSYGVTCMEVWLNCGIFYIGESLQFSNLEATMQDSYPELLKLLKQCMEVSALARVQSFETVVEELEKIIAKKKVKV